MGFSSLNRVLTTSIARGAIFSLAMFKVQYARMAAFIYVRSTTGSDANNGSSWALAKATIAGALAIAVAGDFIAVSQAHAASTAGAVTWTGPTTPFTLPVRIYCVQDSATPPTTMASSATETVNSNAAFTVTGYVALDGISVITGTGAADANANANIGGGTVPSGIVWRNGGVRLNTTSSGAQLNLGQAAAASNDDCAVELDTFNFRTGSILQAIVPRNGRFKIKKLTLDAAGSIPAILVVPLVSASCRLDILNSDLTGRNVGSLMGWVSCTADVAFEDCKLAAATGMAAGTHPGPGGPILTVRRCSAGDVQNYYYKQDYRGTVELDTSIYKTSGGADFDGAPFSIKMASTANVSIDDPLVFEFDVPVETVGSSKTYTFDAVVDNASVTMQNDDICSEIDAKVTSGSTQATTQSNRPATVLTTPTTHGASSATWTGLQATNTKFAMANTFTQQEKAFDAARICLFEASRTVRVDINPTVT